MSEHSQDPTSTGIEKGNSSESSSTIQAITDRREALLKQSKETLAVVEAIRQSAVKRPQASPDATQGPTTFISQDPQVPAVFAQNPLGIAAKISSDSGIGILFDSNSAPCVAAFNNDVNPTIIGRNSANGTGVDAASESGTGLLVSSFSGEAIFASSSLNDAIVGLAINSAGVRGGSTTGTGVRGQSDSATGVIGTSNSGTAIFAQSESGVAIYAQGISGPGVYATSLSGPALVTNGLVQMLSAEAVGQITLPAGQQSITVNTPAATLTSNILLTPLDNPGGQLWVTRATGSFIINSSAAPTNDVPIAYLIIN